MVQTLALPEISDLPESTRDLAAEYQRLLAQSHAATAKAWELQRSENAAIRKDTEASAAAIRQGTKDAGDVHQKAHQKAKAEAERDARNVGLALATCERELVDALTAALPAAVDGYTTMLTEARAECRADIARLAASRERVWQAQRLVNYARLFPSPKALTGGSPLGNVRGLQAPHGDPYDWPTVHGALLADVADPLPPTTPTHYTSRTVTDVNDNGVVQGVSRITEADTALYIPSDPDTAPVVVPSR